MNMFRSLCFFAAAAACVSQSNAFAPISLTFNSVKSAGSNLGATHHPPELNPIDEMCLENVAEFCLHEQCDVEEYEALVNQLQEQRE